MNIAPVLLLAYNRPEKTQRVFDAIAAARPRQLFIAADGPRPALAGDAQKCRDVRDIVMQVKWDCEVKTLFRDGNMGCKNSVPSAIDWFFEHVEEGIILEDDCRPAASFFTYCSELLAKYKNEPRVMMVSGSNMLDRQLPQGPSYYFSKIPHIWGWATWRGSWKHYDVHMSGLHEFIDSQAMAKLFGDQDVRNHWLKSFISTYEGKISTWDYQWCFAIMENSGLVARPRLNLIQNIGFDADGTHLKSESQHFSRQVHEMEEIIHSGEITVNEEFDMEEHVHINNVKCHNQCMALLRWWKLFRRRRKVRRITRRFSDAKAPASS